MAPGVAEPMRSHDVVSVIRSPIAFGEQMFCRALEWGSLVRMNLVPRDEVLGIVQPHQTAAIETAALLGLEGGIAATLESGRHGRRSLMSRGEMLRIA